MSTDAPERVTAPRPPSATVAGSRRAPRRVRRAPALRAAQYLLLAGALLLFAVPLLWLFSSSVKPESDIYAYPLRWIPSWIELSNFADAWTAAPFDRFFMNSIITTVVGTALEIGCAILSAYAFAFVQFRWKAPLFLLMLGSMMLPGHVTLLVNYITVGNLGWLNTYQGIILPGIGSAFAMFLIDRSDAPPQSGRHDQLGFDHGGHGHGRPAHAARLLLRSKAHYRRSRQRCAQGLRPNHLT
jgi:ABC-type Fe3+ transport system permease subunit